MRTFLFAIFLFCSTNAAMAQKNDIQISKGSIYKISEPTGHTYKHIDFPRRNIIIKRGAIANYNSLVGMDIVVKELIMNADGSTTAIIARKDGRPFFRFYPTVEANLEKALAIGELKKS
ncbi:hypothetical protein SB49_13670 [Sediminicola sp. YIK13]|uniref:hypothetical protein n=1 Tax=Sediminicola sp. YIK13 TaxID=1453352 RepID=UPI00071FFDB9|nr:hypothetical protein [Sediminicola sp. YIK13]ALM08741.1 hypothetical protein SB49_13670 [Sediminicola sp. YIK13]